MTTIGREALAWLLIAITGLLLGMLVGMVTRA